MKHCTSLAQRLILACVSGAITVALLPDRPAAAASKIYYCPDRKADQQYSAQLGPGCIPLGDTQQDSQKGTSRRHFEVDNLQQDVSAFLARYQRFLDCCKMDLSELREIEEMADELGQLINSTQANLSNYSLASRGIMLRELLPRIVKARADLKTLRARLEKIGDLSIRRETLDVEEEGKASAHIRELEESIERDIHVPSLPGSAKTGTTIGTAPAVGPAIGRSPKTGTGIGQEGLSGQDIGATPKNSGNIGSSGPTGFEIGATGRAGPPIGESTLNQETSSGVSSTLQRSTVGSSISDSTVGSSLPPSTVGSSMPNAAIDPPIGSSEGGSRLQNH